jgi:hypothetical protein
VRIPDRPSTVQARIKPGVDAKLAAVAEIAGRSEPVELRPEVEFYFESGELCEAM